ncbi:MAG: MBG domain-containing protein [Clostridia bacterium]|nr:MBG domain-containing protein [Clostridia bacterium]
MTGKTELEKKLLGSRLWSIWLWVCIVLSALADVNVLISLALQDISFSYTVFPLILLVLDLALAACAAVSNFRFRHSLIAPIVYGVFTVVVTIAFWIWFALTANYIIFTDKAFIMWIVMQLLTVAVTILSAIRASGSGLLMRVIVFVCAVIYAAYGITYIVMVAEGGFFGQAGSGYSGYSYTLRTLGYTYDESTDSYTASSVLTGDGDTVVVPEEFNGKKVTAISANLLQAHGVRTLVLESEDPVEIRGLGSSSLVMKYSNFRIYSPIAATDYYRNEFYSLAGTAGFDESDDYCPYTDYGNCVKPITEEGQVYVSFTYTYSNLKTANFETLSTLVLDSGTTFQQSLITDSYDYMVYSDEQSEEDRYMSYTTTNRQMLSTFTDEDSQPITGTALKASHDVAVNFTDVYRITVLEDNDDLYTLPASLTSYTSTTTGKSTGYRYVTAGTCGEILNGLTGREGFSYVWEYEMNGYTYTLDDFASVVQDGMEIFPAWEMDIPDAPAISGSTSITYGTALELTAKTEPEYSWMTVSYDWACSAANGTIGYEAKYTNSLATPADSGTYYAYVTVSGPSAGEHATSLSSSNASSVTVSISKMTLSFSWQDDDNMTYSATEKTISCSYNGSQVVNGDAITYSTSNAAATNAGTYTASVSLTGTCADLYAATGTTYSYTISPYDLAVTWGDTTFTYDGSSHVPEYTVHPFEGETAGDSVSGAITNAGSGTAEVSVSNGNYTVSNNTVSFTVEKAPLKVTWPDTELVYSGGSQHPEAEAEGAVSGETVTLYYGSSGFDAGSYSETVYITDGNYYIAEGATTDYTIAKAELSGLVWDSDSFTYNGEIQYPVISGVTGLKGSDKLSSIPFAYTNTESRNAGSYSTAVSLETANYRIAESEEPAYSYTISAYTLEVIWSGTSFTYNGSVQNPVYTYGISTLGEDEITDELLEAAYTADNAADAGTYTASVAISNGNYILSGNETSYTIGKKTVTFAWTNLDLTYNGQAQIPSASTEDLAEGDGVSFTVTGSGTDAGTYTATASLTDDSNYTLSNNSLVYTIAKKALTLTWSGSSFTYSGKAQYPAAISAEGLVDGVDSFDDLTFTYSVTDSVNAGSYTQTATLGSGNYFIAAGSESCGYTISPKTVTITWTDTELTYNGSAQKPSAAAEGIAEGDTVELIISGEATDAGTYTATATLSDSANYTLSNDSCTFTISPKTITIEWNTDGTVPTATLSENVYFTYEYYTEDGTKLSSSPTDPGSYVVKAVLSDTVNCTLSGETQKSFEITEA